MSNDRRRQARPRRRGGFRTFLGKALLVLICVGLGVGSAALYLEVTPRVFDACSTLRYSLPQQGVLRLEGVMPEQGRGPITAGRLQAIGLTLLDPGLLTSVIESNDLDQDPRLLAGSPGAAALLRSLIQVDIDEQSQVIGIHVRHENPQLAAQLANALADALAAKSGQTREEVVRKAMTRLEEVMRTVRSETAATQDWPRARDVNEAEELRENEAELWVLDRSRAETLVERIRLETELAELKRNSTNTSDLLKIPSVSDDPHVEAINKQLVSREIDIMRLRGQGIPETNAELRRVEGEMETLRSALTEAVAIAADRLQMDLAKVKAQEQDLQTTYAQLSDRQRALQSESTTDAGNSAPTDARQRMWMRLQEGLQEIELAGQIFGVPLQSGERATPLNLPSRPDRPRTLLWGAGSGLALGLLLLMFLGGPDLTVKAVADLESEIDLPVLGGIPRVTNSQSADAAAEAFRTLQAAFGVMCKQSVPRSFLVTSSLAQEGKTFCSVSFAVSLAQQGFSTLLVDADLRRPMGEHSVPGVSKRGIGLADYLGRCQVRKRVISRESEAPRATGLSFAELRRKQADQAEQVLPEKPDAERSAPQEPLRVQEVSQSTAVKHLRFLSAGTTGNHAPELLGKEGAFAQLLAEALEDFDRVVIDSAPLLGVSDSLLLLEHVDAACFVVRAAKTPIAALERVLEMLKNIDPPAVGFLLNDVLSRDLETYG